MPQVGPSTVPMVGRVSSTASLHSLNPSRNSPARGPTGTACSSSVWCREMATNFGAKDTAGSATAGGGLGAQTPCAASSPHNGQ